MLESGHSNLIDTDTFAWVIIAFQYQDFVAFFAISTSQITE
jgi:hypothetical protein